MSLFAPVDTLDTSTFLRGVVQPGGAETGEHILLPVTGLENNGQPVTPKGFGSLYGLFLTIDATLAANNSFTSMNVTLWADPKNDAETPGVSVTSDPAFSNGMAHDIVLATGTMVSASLSLDPATQIRHGDFVESMTPTLAGSVLHGSIQPGTLLHEQLTTPPTAFQSLPQPDGTTVNLVTDGAAQVTLDPEGTILVPNISLGNLHLAHGPTFMHGRDGGGHHFEGRGRND
jgi:hypothetical protein